MVITKTWNRGGATMSFPPFLVLGMFLVYWHLKEIIIFATIINRYQNTYQNEKHLHTIIVQHDGGRGEHSFRNRRCLKGPLGLPDG